MLGGMERLLFVTIFQVHWVSIRITLNYLNEANILVCDWLQSVSNDFQMFSLPSVVNSLFTCCLKFIRKNYHSYILISPHDGIFYNQYWHLHGSNTFHCPYPGICSLSQHIKCNDFLPQATGSRTSSECCWSWLMTPTLKTASIWPLCMDTCLSFPPVSPAAPRALGLTVNMLKVLTKSVLTKTDQTFPQFCPMMSRLLLQTKDGNSFQTAVEILCLGVFV